MLECLSKITLSRLGAHDAAAAFSYPFLPLRARTKFKFLRAAIVPSRKGFPGAGKFN
jgi:hypothetical protein